MQEITVSLKEAKEDLKETEYDKYISDQSALLDELYSEYELILNERLDNIDSLLSDVITEVNANASTIKDTLVSETEKVGTTISDTMISIWDTDGKAKKVIAEYGDGFQTKQTSTNFALDNIKADVHSMVDDIDKESQSKVDTPKTQPSSVANPTETSSGSNGNSNNNTNTPSSPSGDGKPNVGDKVKFISGKYYYDSQGKSPIGSKFQGKQVYITNINTKSRATHPYHISTGKKLGSGDLGWLKLDQLSGYASGKKNISNNEYAWTQENGREFIIRPSDGAILTPVAKKDSVLTSAASNNIWQMANSPTDFIRDNLNFDSSSIPNNSTVQSNYTQHLDKVIFSFPNVKNYDEMLSAMQKDKNFERLVTSMTIDQVVGKSSLMKGKSIR